MDTRTANIKNLRYHRFSLLGGLSVSRILRWRSLK